MRMLKQATFPSAIGEWETFNNEVSEVRLIVELAKTFKAFLFRSLMSLTTIWHISFVFDLTDLIFVRPLE
jgi:hypothetical protein